VATEYYFPVFLNDFSPEDRYTRCQWIDQLSLQFPIMLYKFAHGSMIGTMSFVWKTQENTNDPTKTNQVITNINQSMPQGQ